jgi:hypothetical protein
MPTCRRLPPCRVLIWPVTVVAGRAGTLMSIARGDCCGALFNACSSAAFLVSRQSGPLGGGGTAGSCRGWGGRTLSRAHPGADNQAALPVASGHGRQGQSAHQRAAARGSSAAGAAPAASGSALGGRTGQTGALPPAAAAGAMSASPAVCCHRCPDLSPVQEPKCPGASAHVSSPLARPVALRLALCHAMGVDEHICETIKEKKLS